MINCGALVNQLSTKMMPGYLQIDDTILLDHRLRPFTSNMNFLLFSTKHSSKMHHFGDRSMRETGKQYCWDVI